MVQLFRKRCTRRIRERDTDLGWVEKVNALSRKICANPMGLEKLQKEIRAIQEEKKASPYLQLIMYMMISASLSVFLEERRRMVWRHPFLEWCCLRLCMEVLPLR